jgi:DNA replication licensing factor MCM6
MAEEGAGQQLTDVMFQENAKQIFSLFLEQFQKQQPEEPAEGEVPSQGAPHYAAEVQRMRNNESFTLFVDFTDVLVWSGDLANTLREKYYLVEPALRKAVQNFVRAVEPGFVVDDDGCDREFYLNLYNLDKMDKLRDLKVSFVGKLCCFSGTVTRTSEVRPELYLGCFRCLECNTKVAGVEQQFKYTSPLICTNRTCGNRSADRRSRNNCTGALLGRGRGGRARTGL